MILPTPYGSGRQKLSPASPTMEGRGEMAKEAAFQRVRENFQRVEEFGWFAPTKSWTKKFKAWPKGKCLDGLGYRQAAVLFLLTHHRGELHVLITKRSYNVTTHKGKTALHFAKDSGCSVDKTSMQVQWGYKTISIFI